jgi:multidrug efflux pump subunit AcrA (membrane-fusion protein)
MAGIIVSGDLSQQLGSPVQKGQLLFEVAPLHDYRVVLQVEERDIDLLSVGQSGRLMLTALAGQEIPLKITQISPVTEVVEGSNRFRVEASLEAGEEMLRPGMKGIARLDTGEDRIVWVWLRGLVEWSRLTLWKWWGL